MYRFFFRKSQLASAYTIRKTLAALNVLSYLSFNSFRLSSSAVSVTPIIVSRHIYFPLFLLSLSRLLPFTSYVSIPSLSFQFLKLRILQISIPSSDNHFSSFLNKILFYFSGSGFSLLPNLLSTVLSRFEPPTIATSTEPSRP